MIKGALFDIDDTLYSHVTHEVPKKTYMLLDELKKKGIKIGVCTSRVIKEMDRFPDELLDRIDCMILGTGAVTMVEGKYFKSYAIDNTKAKAYAEYFKENNISYHYCDINGDLFFWGDTSLLDDEVILRYAKGKVMIKEYEDDIITNLFFYFATEEQCKHILEMYPEMLISTWGTSGNICAELVDKSFGLMKFCQMYSFTTDEIIAAGDGGNDDVMLLMAGIGIATDDAKEKTKKAADYICRKSIEDGGLYEAFKELGVI